MIEFAKKVLAWVQRSALYDFFLQFINREIPLRAAALSFHSLMSIVPLCGLVFWYLNRIGITQSWIETARNYLLSNLHFGNDSTILERFSQFTDNVSSTSWGLVGLIVFLYTSVNLLVAVGNHLDRALNDEEVSLLDLKISVFKTYSRRVVFLSIFPLALMISIALMAWIKHSAVLQFVFNIKFVGSYIAMPIPWLIDAFAIFLVYYYVPNVRIKARQAMMGALVAAPLFNIGKWAMGLYSQHALTTQKIYGAFSVLPLFLLWIQFAWMIFLAGAVFIERVSSRSKKYPKESPVK